MGATVGNDVGATLGFEVGTDVGCDVGPDVGTTVGAGVGDSKINWPLSSIDTKLSESSLLPLGCNVLYADLVKDPTSRPAVTVSLRPRAERTCLKTHVFPALPPIPRYSIMCSHASVFVMNDCVPWSSQFMRLGSNIVAFK